MALQEPEAGDERLIDPAREVLRRNYHALRHQVGAAVLCGSGKVYAAVNVEAVGYGPCAEPIALGMALSAGERDLRMIVAVCRDGEEFPVVSPCGNCRQLLLDYAPEAAVILVSEGRVVKGRATDLLPGAFRSDFG